MAFFFLIIYCIALLIRPHEWGVIINDESTLIRNSLLLCMAFFFFCRHKNLDSPQLLLIVLLLFSVFISLISIGWFGGATLYGEQFIRTIFIPFVLVSGVLDSTKKQYMVFATIIIAALVMVLNGHIQVTSEDELGLVGNPVYHVREDIRIRYLGYFNDPNDLGMFLIMSLPLAFLFKNMAPKILKLPLWLSIGAILYGIVLTNSRGTLLATMSLTFFWFWRTYGTSKTFLLGIAMSPGLLLILSRFRTISADDASAQGRLDAWYAGYQMLVSSPIFGVGQNQFMDYHGQTAHNSFVLAFAELGLFGCLVWVGLLVLTVLSLLSISKKSFIRPTPDLDGKKFQLLSRESEIATALLYSFLAYMVAGFFLSRTYVPLLYLYLGMASACWGRVRLAYPGPIEVVDYQQAAKYTFGITGAGILATYLMLKIFL